MNHQAGKWLQMVEWRSDHGETGGRRVFAVDCDRSPVVRLIISARLRKFCRSLPEEAFDLGASPFEVLTTIKLAELKPALMGSGLISFLMSLETFNTTLKLVGSDPPLTITMFDRMKEGSTPLLNAVSLLLMLASALLELMSILAQRDRGAKVH